MKKVVIAGANSFVASHFVHELLVQGFPVIGLVRGMDNESAKDRMHRAFLDTTLPPIFDSENPKVFDYNLLDNDFSLDKHEFKEIFDKDVDFFHFAANLKFDHQSKEEIFETNIKGLENALQIFQKYATTESRFFFISTAYSCGIFSGLFEERFYPNQDIGAFRNYYEQSKRFAENVLQKYRKEYGLNAHVIRLSQVVGNNQTGVTRTDYGIFDFARRIHSFSTKYPHQTVRIYADPEATQNLIPIDTLVSDLMCVIARREVPVVMNFVAKNPILNRKIIRSITELLPIELILDHEIDPENMTPLERKILRSMPFTGRYTNFSVKFDTKERDKVIPNHLQEVNESSVFTMLSYFLGRIMEEDASVANNIRD